MVDVKNILGYVFSIVGLLGLVASSSDAVKNAVFGFLPENIVKLIGTSLLIGSLIVLGVGIVLLFLVGKSGGKGKEEVPIYKGKKIVGYRRV